MPPIANMDLRPVVYKWITEKDRRPRQKFDMATVKAQEHFHNMFESSQGRRRKIETAKLKNYKDEFETFFD